MIKQLILWIFLKMSTISNLIKKQPIYIKKLYYNIIPFRYRYHKVFRQTYDFLNKSQHWSTDKLNSYQIGKLSHLLLHSYNNVPYYKNLFDKLKLHPTDIKNIHDLSKIPILTKDLIKKNAKMLIATNINKSKLLKFQTSGSTGERFEFIGTDEMYKKEAAFVLRAFHSHGATMYNQPSIWLRRYSPNNGKTLWYYDHELKRLYMSPYHINKDTIKSYLYKMNSINASTLVGYPSSIYILACYIEELGLKLNNVKYIHVASEKILPEWKEKIESVLNIQVKAHYGQMEKVSFFYQTEFSDNYTEALEYGVTQFEKDPETSESTIIATGFLNYAMPFIRYQMNDTAVLNYTNSEFGLPETVIDFNGRSDDILTTIKGSKIPGVNFYTMMYNIPGVMMFQLVQVSRELINVIIVPDKKYFSDETNAVIKNGIKVRMGSIKVKITIVDEILRSKKTGKIKCIINEIQ